MSIRDDNEQRSWPTRSGICAYCRRAVSDNSGCDCDSPNRILFGDTAARRELSIAVWDKGADKVLAVIDENQQKPPVLAWLTAFGATAMLIAGMATTQVWLMVSSILFLLAFSFVLQQAEKRRLTGRRRIARPPGMKPIGATRPRPQLVGATSIVGVVDDSPLQLSPIGRIPCVAFSVELRNQDAHESTLLLRDGATCGFHITTDDQQIVWIPPGIIDMVNGHTPVDDFDARLYLARLDPLSESFTGADPFPFEQALESALQPGNRVRVHNPIQLTPHAPAGHAIPESGYRQSAGNVMVPRGTPRIEIVTDQPSVPDVSR